MQQLWTIDGGEKQKISQFCQRNQLNLQTVFDANKECTEESLLINFENHVRKLALYNSIYDNARKYLIDFFMFVAAVKYESISYTGTFTGFIITSDEVTR